MPVRKRRWNGTEGAGRPGGDDAPAVYSGSMIVGGQGVVLTSKLLAKAAMADELGMKVFICGSFDLKDSLEYRAKGKK